MNTLGKMLLGLVLIAVSTVAGGVLPESVAADRDERAWPFRPVGSVVPPMVRESRRVLSPVDAFVFEKLDAKELRFAPIAGRRTLIRRLTFDLTGLPATTDAINEFLSDDSPDALAKVVDRLLASPLYGERWGRHWLDVVRYADARDLIQLPAESDFREAWRYRDWVVAGLNSDLPYDQFIRMQIAGDAMQPADPSRIDADALVATGLLAIADFVPGDVDKQQMIADYVNDQIDVVGRAVLGMTLACARCHDHKFDPISTEDYYALAGIFFSTRLIPGPVKGNTPLVRVPLLPPAEVAAIEAEQARDKSRIAALPREIAECSERDYRDYLQRQVESQTQRYLVAAWEFVHTPSESTRTELHQFANARDLDEVVLRRWITYFEEKVRHSALALLLDAADMSVAEQRVRELAAALSSTAADHRAKESIDPQRAELASLSFRADDRRIAVGDSQRVVLWPNRGRHLENAQPVADAAAPEIAKTPIQGGHRSVLRFSGKELLQVPAVVPAVGSLFVVFQPDPSGPSGQRVVGWEDSSVGQHGLGIMTNGAGAVQVILRRNGASGDVSLPAPSPAPAASEFQILSIVWGTGGVRVYRQGKLVGEAKGIDSVSSDPAITSLRIGGPGSGASARFQGRLAELRVYHKPLDDAARSQVETELSQRWCSPAEIPSTIDPVADLYAELVSAHSPYRLEGADREKALPRDLQGRLIELRHELEALQKKKPREIPRAVVVQEGGPIGTMHEGCHDAYVYIRGNHEKLGSIVPRGVPKSIAGPEPFVIREGSGRRELAHWLTQPSNPLTARVMANRIWQHHFGVGLVPTSTNFGAMGESPSHPELLDYLAKRFVESGWSIKSMHRLLILSTVYQQTSASSPAGLAVDPENRLLWRANRRRLESEALRDSLLFVAGRLNTVPGGVGFQDVATPRRSVYLMSVRTGAKTAEFGPLFDAADCSGIVERRNESIVAPQSLFLMNDPLVTELASALAERVIVELGQAVDRTTIRNAELIGRLYEIALGRTPSEVELEIGEVFLRDSPDTNTWARYCRLILCTNEFLFID